MDVPLWIWFAVLGVIVAMLAVDLAAHRVAHEVSVKEAATWSALWLSFGLGFGLVVWAGWGSQPAGGYFAGYLIEKSLAVDNVFVFALIFTAFAVPRAYQHRVLFFGSGSAGDVRSARTARPADRHRHPRRAPVTAHHAIGRRP